MVCLEDGKITRVGRWDGTPATDLGDVVLMPGLINAHCHLDFTVMRGAILPNASFSQWVRRINDLTRTLRDDEYLASIAAGFEELRNYGTTSVLNIESFPELMVRMPPPPLRTWWFYEMIDLRNRFHTEEVVAGALSFFETRPGWLGGFGLSPHAPYTASPELYRLSKFCCEKYGMPFTTHVAESDEEFAMFFYADGPLHGFLSELGRDMSDTGIFSPLARLHNDGSLPAGALLAHMNTLAESDWALLRGRDYSVVHCPCCHEYFDRPEFPLERFLKEGINVCLGTDSLASNKKLSLFAEMQRLAKTHPGIPPASLLEMVTCKAAAAIGMAGKLGELSPGAEADLIAIPFAGSVKDVPEALVHHNAAVDWVLLAGQQLPALL